MPAAISERPGALSGRLEVPASLERLPAPLSLRTILAIWAAATLPMGVAAWIAAPLLASTTRGADALPKGLLVTLSLGLVWQFALVVGLVYREQASLSWSTVRAVLWLRSPQSPGSKRRGGRLWLVVPLMIIGLVLVEAVPAIPHPVNRDLGQFLGTPAGHAFLRGAWGWLAVIALLLVFNTVLGEELLFRGFLLPRMNQAFGRMDWLANGVLFALYHVHTPWTIPLVLFDSIFLAYPARRYRSALISILAHSAQSVLILGISIALVLS